MDLVRQFGGRRNRVVTCSVILNSFPFQGDDRRIEILGLAVESRRRQQLAGFSVAEKDVSLVPFDSPFLLRSHRPTKSDIRSMKQLETEGFFRKSLRCNWFCKFVSLVRLAKSLFAKSRRSIKVIFISCFQKTCMNWPLERHYI